MLQQAGFTNVKNLYGGIFQWMNEKKPVYNHKGLTQQVHPYSRSWGIWLQRGEKVYATE
jgi:3-mercaptopyruvate sulfurtransferase SseA